MTTQIEGVFEDISSLGKRAQKMIDKNDQSMLGGHGKQVIKADAEEFISNVKPREEERAMCHQDWRDDRQVLYTKVDTTQGVLYFLPTGIFFGWNEPLSDFSHESITHVEIHEGPKTKKTFDIILKVTEPYYHSGKTTKVDFKGLSKQDFEPVKRYLYMKCAKKVELAR